MTFYSNISIFFYNIFSFLISDSTIELVESGNPELIDFTSLLFTDQIILFFLIVGLPFILIAVFISILFAILAYSVEISLNVIKKEFVAKDILSYYSKFYSKYGFVYKIRNTIIALLCFLPILFNMLNVFNPAQVTALNLALVGFGIMYKNINKLGSEPKKFKIGGK